MHPLSINIEASNHCQLRCATCPTASGEVHQAIGAGHLKAAELEAFLDAHPDLLHIELSNWGEVLLNPQLPEILRIAYERDVLVTILNGVNFNHASPAALEALVAYRVRGITFALDGASQQSYSSYRVRGDYDRVIANIRALNRVKAQHHSYFPVLLWQFVAFGHNEHEIDTARSVARSLGMHFYVKLAWDDFSPVQDEDRIRAVSQGKAASREDYLEQTGSIYLQKALCRQLWNNPQVNFDGEVLGCCANRWSSFGNAFDDGLKAVLQGEKMQYAKRMLQGREEPREDIACVHCELFQSMVDRGDFMGPGDLDDPVRKYLRSPVARKIGKRLVRVLGRSRRVSRYLIRPLVDRALDRLLSRPF